MAGIQGLTRELATQGSGSTGHQDLHRADSKDARA